VHVQTACSKTSAAALRYRPQSTLSPNTTEFNEEEQQEEKEAVAVARARAAARAAVTKTTTTTT
jgi:hypothetical protein